MRSLRSRLIVSHILPILVIIPVIGVAVLYLLETQLLLANYTNELVRQSVLVAEVAGAYTEIWFDPSRAQAFVNQVSPRVTAKVMLLDPTGRLLVSSDANDSGLIGQVFNQENIERLLEGDTDPQINYKDSQVSEVLVPVITPSRRLLGVVRLDNPLSVVYERAQALRRATVWVLAGCLLLGVILGSILATDIARPLRKLTQAVSQVTVSPQLSPIEETGPEEIRSLERAFNTLLERLRTLEGGRRRLLANLVHELGRPLGALHSAVQALRGGADEEPELRKELLAGMDGELDRLQSLLDDLSHLHDQVLGPLELNLQAVPLSDWLPLVSAPWREAANEKGLQWMSETPEQLPTLKADPDRLAQALGNLLSNAIRYTPSGGTVTMRVLVEPETCSIQVEDNGPGIEPEEQGKVFSPFYRGRSARRFSDGMGLGLTITRDLVEAHGGNLVIDSQPGQGSRFTIQIPIEPLS